MTVVDGQPWKPTTSHLRACVIGIVVAISAVSFGRPDLLVLGTPLLVIALWLVLTRPRDVPRISSRLSHSTLREGDATTWTTSITTTEGTDHVAAVLAAGRWSTLRPTSGACTAAAPVPPGEVDLTFALRSTRWGHREMGPGLTAATSSWGSFRSGPTQVDPLRLATVPLPSTFDARAPLPHPSGLVGLHQSRRRGDGTEFAGIRPFQMGDRLRRIHWPVSLRTGQLHVAATYADRDTHVVLVVDAGNDLGESEGVDGAASSLDLTVRAAGALTEHFLQRGDRVGLHVFGTPRPIRITAAGGRAHLRRTLDMLSRIEVGSGRDRVAQPGRLGVTPGGLVLMLSPLIAPVALRQAVALARRQLSVVVIDTLPYNLTEPGTDPMAAIAWRIRLLERAREVRLVQQAGVPVVQWRGPGSLDQVLRDIGRRARAPRMAVR